ncbi:hypothetical protein HK096_004855 [Nowakowskiella sp. JEL0078]|nr:hypothetical protein HK096_004855 [Nowakowskiella sp. JEL0078]
MSPSAYSDEAESQIGPSVADITSYLQSRFRSKTYYTRIGTSSMISLLPIDSDYSTGSDEIENSILRWGSKNPAALSSPLKKKRSSKHVKDPSISSISASVSSHIYELAAAAHTHMLKSKEDQFVIFSGESGSGKSNSRKHFVDGLIALSRAGGSQKSRVHSAASKMEFVLESFGHARTNQSSNASQYGRFTEYQFTDNGSLMGLKVLHYLLNKDRVCGNMASSDEFFNYHIFYYLLAGASPEDKAKWQLYSVDPSQYAFLGGKSKSEVAEGGFKIFGSRKPTESKSVPSVVLQNVTEEKLKYKELTEMMKSVGIKEKTQKFIFQLLAAILHLGNIVFVPEKSACVIKSPEEALSQVSDLLGINPEKISLLLLNKTKLVGKDLFSRPLDAKSAEQNRDSLASTFYALLFSWIVESINHRFSVPDIEVASFIATIDFPGINTSKSTRSDSKMPNMFSGFNELCWNMTSERLINFSQKSLFENVPNDVEVQVNVDYNSNEQVISLISNPNVSIITLIDEVSIMDNTKTRLNAPDSRDKELVQLLQKRLSKNTSILFSSKPNKTVLHSFGISHYNIDVFYDTSGFAVKNIDDLSADFVSLFREDETTVNGAKSFTDEEDSDAENTYLRQKKTRLHSTHEFVAHLFSRTTGIRTEVVREKIVSANFPRKPLRRPSLLKRGILTNSPTSSRSNTPDTQKNVKWLVGEDENSAIDSAQLSPTRDSALPGRLSLTKMLENKDEDTTTVSAQNTAVNEIFLAVEKARLWTVFCIRINREDMSTDFDSKTVIDQLKAFNIPELTKLKSVCDFTVSKRPSEFLNKYRAVLERYHPSIFLAEDLTSENVLVASGSKSRASLKIRGLHREQVDRVREFLNLAAWTPRDFSIGSGKIHMSEIVWKWFELELASTEQLTRLNPADSPLIPKTVFKRSSYLTDEETYSLSDTGSSVETLMQKLSTDQLLKKSGDLELGRLSRPRFNPADQLDNFQTNAEIFRRSMSHYTKFPESNPFNNSNDQFAKSPTKQLSEPKVLVPPKVEVRASRRSFWIIISWMLTFCVPNFILRLCCKLVRPEARMAWREKFALCFFIFVASTSLLFYLIGLRYIICPNVEVFSMNEIATLGTTLNKPFVTAFGRYLDITELVSSHTLNYGFGPGAVQPYEMQAFYGSDVSNLFYKLDSFETVCPGLTAPSPSDWDYLDQSVSWMKRPILATPKNPQGSNRTLHRASIGGKPEQYWVSMYKYQKGRVGWSPADLKKMSQRTVIIYDNVYLVNSYLNVQNDMFPVAVKSFFQSSNPGEDMTSTWNRLRQNDPKTYDRVFQCMNQLFYIGTVDRRNDGWCLFANWIPLSATIFISAIILVKCFTAIRCTKIKDPEPSDKFLVCLITCHSEKFDSLNQTIESVALQEYDDTRKLLFIVVDGMTIGAENDQPTPHIVFEILGIDRSAIMEDYSYISLGERSKQHNMARIYSGLYQIAGHSVPFLVVVKVGAPGERVDPGYRGKRDSQLILLNFLSKVHPSSNIGLNPLELEMYHNMKNVIGVPPLFYEYVLMVDAGTQIENKSVNRLMSSMAHDSKTMGICGETFLRNDRESWITMIQVYEHFFSNSITKSFESLFGSVTHLPGNFCIYRLKSPTGSGSVRDLVLLHPNILDEYRSNEIVTMHQKNLLQIGEDRYLTTLMLKHFPKYKTRFVSEAKAYIEAPDDWKDFKAQKKAQVNSQIHNLFELVRTPRLCGFCCFSLRFLFLIDLLLAVVKPALFLYLGYLIYFAVSTQNVSHDIKYNLELLI